MNKLMCRFVATTKEKKKIPDPNLDTACPAGIPCNNLSGSNCISLRKFSNLPFKKTYTNAIRQGTTFQLTWL